MVLPGKRATFERLVSANLPVALRFAVRLTGRLDTAEDVVQEAMLRASRSWQSFRGESQFKTWLLRIVINVYRDQHRGPATPEKLIDDLVESDQPTSCDVAAAAELADRIAHGVAALPLRQREVLVLSAYEGLTTREIADTLGISEANVYSTLNAARDKLRRVLAPYLAEK